MKLIFSYKGITKVMTNVESFPEMEKFVKNNYFLTLSKWSMYYIDSDDDKISLSSEMDLSTLL
jgi:hypothetical protein